MAESWFVLRSSTRDEILLRCTHDRFVEVPLGARPPSEDPRLERVFADAPEEHSPFEPEGEQHHTPDDEPEATRVDDHIALAGDGTERYFVALAASVRRAMGEREADVYLADDESRAALFEAVTDLPIAGLLDAADASSEELWELSRMAREA